MGDLGNRGLRKKFQSPTSLNVLKRNNVSVETGGNLGLERTGDIELQMVSIWAALNRKDRTMIHLHFSHLELKKKERESLDFLLISFLYRNGVSRFPQVPQPGKAVIVDRKNNKGK